MKTLILGLLLAGAVAWGVSAGGTETCFYSGEKDAGMNKICYYNCPSGEAAITIKNTKLCPLRIKR